MTRVVRRPDGSVATDPTGKAPGRGTYLCSDPACNEPARLAEGVQRALGAAIGSQPPPVEETHATT